MRGEDERRLTEAPRGREEAALAAFAPKHRLLSPQTGEERRSLTEFLDQSAHRRIAEAAAEVGAKLGDDPPRAILPIVDQPRRSRRAEDEAHQVAVVVAVEPADEKLRLRRGSTRARSIGRREGRRGSSSAPAAAALLRARPPRPRRALPGRACPPARTDRRARPARGAAPRRGGASRRAEAETSRPCSSHAIQVRLAPQASAISSRRRPGVRRRPAPPAGRGRRSRWARRKAPRARRASGVDMAPFITG